MDVRLVLDRGSGQRQAWHLHHKNTVVGRRRDCHLRILSSKVSRRHCVLCIEDGYVNVQDLDSSNGTFINGERVAGKQVLRPGDHLEIGPLAFIVEYELSSASEEGLEQGGLGTGAEMEVIPLRDEDPEDSSVVVADGEERVDVLPVADEDTEPEQVKQSDVASAPAAVDEKESLRVTDEEAAGWHLPQTSDLRDLLSQMEAPESRPRRRER